MPTKLPKFQVTLPNELYRALKERAGQQGMSAYVRGLIEIDLGMSVDVQHGGKRDKSAQHDGQR